MAHAAVPTGEVTLAFTDIEGSTRLIHELGDGYLAVLDVHHQRIRQAVADHGGIVVRTEGDSFFLAFEDPAAAVAACVAAQQSLAEADWPHGRPVRVRMGIHRGRVATLDVDGEPDFIGLAVHEAARVADAATGGTVLLSEAVATAVGDRLPDGAVLEDMGRHLLRDFPTACRLFAVSHPDLPVGSRALRAAPATRSRLPAPPAPLIGREEELHRLASLVLGSSRLVSVIGPGGVGKTRLALEVAWQVRSRFSAGIWFVDLAAVTDAPGVITAILDALESTAQVADPIAAVRAVVGQEPSLLLLDNFEQVRDGAGAVAELLEACPELHVFVTSRERLRLRAEYTVTLDGLPAGVAGELLRERAEASGVTLDHDEATEAVAGELCAHLGGLPLAIELAAARLDAFSLDALIDELSRGLDSLSDGPVDLPPRQRALRATIQWSVGLLTRDEQRVLESLGVFAGGAALPEIARVAGALGAEGDCEDVLAALIDKSLVQPGDGKPDRPRVAVQEVIRQFAEEELRRDSDRWATACGAHLDAMTRLVLRAEPHLTGSEQGTWMDVLSLEHDNLRAALDRAPARSAWALADALPNYWTARGHWSEARRALEHVTAAPGGDDLARAKLTAALAYYCERLGDLAEADAHAQQALAVAEQVGDRALCARIANVLGDVASVQGEIEIGTGWYEKALAWADESADRNQRAVALSNLGVLAWQANRVAEARTHWTAALALATELGQTRSIAILTGDLGLLDRADGDLDTADARFRAGLGLAVDLADPVLHADAHLNLGVVAKDRGDEAAARDLYMEALTTYERLGHVRSAAIALLHLALATDELAQAKGWAEAARTRAMACGDQLRIGEADSILAALAELET
jgi:predicted ATPase/class 3 adenylate cyclase